MLETTILEYEVDCIDRKKLIKKTVLDKFHAKKNKIVGLLPGYKWYRLNIQGGITPLIIDNVCSRWDSYLNVKW